MKYGYVKVAVAVPRVKVADWVIKLVSFSCRYRENVFPLSLLIRILPYLCTE